MRKLTDMTRPSYLLFFNCLECLSGRGGDQKTSRGLALSIGKNVITKGNMTSNTGPSSPIQ